MFILGLRNYGLQYQNTVHNLGEFFILYTHNIMDKIFYSCIKERNTHTNGNYTMYTYKFNNDIVLFMLLLNTYINNSGDYLIRCTELEPIIKNNFFIMVYDDILLPSGRIKTNILKFNTKHNGVLNIITNYIKTKIICIRIGATKPANITSNEFVLSKINKHEYENHLYRYIVDLLDYITDNQYNKDNQELLVKYLQSYNANSNH